jgi:hypothetical protein
MLTPYYRALILNAAGGALLLIASAAIFASTAQDSWFALVALLMSACGIALLSYAIRMWIQKIGDRGAQRAKARSIQQGCALAIIRFGLIVVTIVAAGCWLWFMISDLNEVRMLLSSPVVTSAQVIGKDLVRPEAPIGYVHYSYRVTSTLAPEDRFAIAHSEYNRYRAGQAFTLTYASVNPRVHRIGQVDWSFALRRLVYWSLVFLNSAGFLLMPLWVLEYYRQPRDAPKSP